MFWVFCFSLLHSNVLNKLHLCVFKEALQMFQVQILSGRSFFKSYVNLGLIRTLTRRPFSSSLGQWTVHSCTVWTLKLILSQEVFRAEKFVEAKKLNSCISTGNVIKAHQLLLQTPCDGFIFKVGTWPDSWHAGLHGDPTRIRPDEPVRLCSSLSKNNKYVLHKKEQRGKSQTPCLCKRGNYQEKQIAEREYSENTSQTEIGKELNCVRSCMKGAGKSGWD